MDLKKFLNVVPIIQIVGAKNQGKTKLIQQILPILRGKNRTILTFKHSYHKHPIDKPGSDSDKYRRAGASVSVFQSAEGTAFFFPPEDIKLSELVLKALIPQIDLILVESFSSLPAPKILVHQTEIKLPLPSNIIAIIGKTIPDLVNIPVLPFDGEKVASFIYNQLQW